MEQFCKHDENDYSTGVCTSLCNRQFSVVISDVIFKPGARRPAAGARLVS